jgi:hypothetical protein
MKLTESIHIGFKKQKINRVKLNRYRVDKFSVKSQYMQPDAIVFSRSLKDEFKYNIV